MAKKTTTSIATQQPKTGLATVRSLFERQTGELSKALGSQMDTDRFIRTALTAYSRGDERFQSAAPISLLGSCMKAAELRLSVDPMLGEFWLVPRRNRKRGCMWIEGQLGYKGLIKLAKRNPELRNVKAELVHEGDFFEYELGSKPYIRHRFDEKLRERPELRLAYATVFYRDGSTCSHVSPMYEILEARQRSEAFRNGMGPWTEHFNSMARIVPVRALMKLESIDSVLLEQLNREERSQNGDVIEIEMDSDALSGEEVPPVIEAPEDVDALKSQFAVGSGEAG